MRHLGARGVVALLAAAAPGCTFFFGPRLRPTTALKVEATPALLARGEYLVKHVAGCRHCHSAHDFGRFAWPPKPGGEYAGGDCFGAEAGMPGTVCFSNISADQSSGIGAWTDDEIIRAIREGVGRKGRALFPMMPYEGFRTMSDEDVQAIVAYLRTVPQVANRVPEPQIGFPVGNFINDVPQPVTERVRAPDPSDSVAHGRYVVTLAGCKDCHTRREGPNFVESMAFAGGAEFKIPDVVHNVTANITPHEATGIGKMTKEDFIQRFKKYAVAVEELPELPWERRTFMPWWDYSGMTEQDLGAIYDYLRTLKPIENKVETTIPSSKEIAPLHAGG